jgi:hypothetical protein
VAINLTQYIERSGGKNRTLCQLTSKKKNVIIILKYTYVHGAESYKAGTVQLARLSLPSDPAIDRLPNDAEIANYISRRPGATELLQRTRLRRVRIGETIVGEAGVARKPTFLITQGTFVKIQGTFV